MPSKLDDVKIYSFSYFSINSISLKNKYNLTSELIFGTLIVGVEGVPTPLERLLAEEGAPPTYFFFFDLIFFF